MSINGVKENELTFTEREQQQAYLIAHKTLRPDFIKSPNKGLRAFIFYRNLLLLGSIKKPHHQQDIVVSRPTTLIFHKR